MVTPDALFTLFGMSTKLFLIHFHLYVRFFFFFSFVFALVSFLSEPSSAIPAHESQKKNKRICSSFNDGSLLDLYPLSLSLSLYFQSSLSSHSSFSFTRSVRLGFYSRSTTRIKVFSLFFYYYFGFERCPTPCRRRRRNVLIGRLCFVFFLRRRCLRRRPPRQDPLQQEGHGSHSDGRAPPSATG